MLQQFHKQSKFIVVLNEKVCFSRDTKFSSKNVMENFSQQALEIRKLSKENSFHLSSFNEFLRRC